MSRRVITFIAGVVVVAATSTALFIFLPKTRTRSANKPLVTASDRNKQWQIGNVRTNGAWLGKSYQGYQAKTANGSAVAQVQAQTPRGTTGTTRPNEGVIYVDSKGGLHVALTLMSSPPKGQYQRLANGSALMKTSEGQGVVRIAGRHYSLAVMPPLRLKTVAADLTINK
jgi:hypothetical protein